MTQATQAAFDRHIDAGATDRAGTIARSAAGLPAGIRLSYHDDLTEVEQDWRGFEQGADCTAFQSFDWLSTWHRHIGAREGVKPAIVIGRQDDEIIFILPLGLAPGLLRRVTWFGEFLSNSSAPLLAGYFAQRVNSAQFLSLWREIERLLRVKLRHDLIDLDKIPERVGAQANPMLALSVTPHANDAYLVHLGPTWEEFYQSKRSASWRKTDNKKRRKLAKQGDINFSTATDRATIERTIDTLIEQKKSSYASLGVANMFEWPGYHDFFLDLATDPKRHGLVHVSSVSVGPTIVAASIGLTLHGNYDYVLAGYAMGEYEGSSPGTIHLQELMQHFTGRGFKTFDFNIGDEPYKREWCDTETKFYDYVSPVTVAGWATSIVMQVTRVAKRFIKRNPAIWPVIRKSALGAWLVARVAAMNVRALTMGKFSLGGRLGGGLFSTSVMLLAARVVGLLAGFGTQVLLARMLEPEGLGIFYFATSIAYLVSMIAAFGYPVIAVRFISRYRTQGNDMLKAAFVNRAQMDTAIVSVAGMALVVAFAAIIPADTQTRLAVGAAALAIPALALSRIYSTVAGAIREFALSYMLNLLWRPLLFIVVIGFAAVAFATSSAIMAALVFSFVSVVIVALQFNGLMKHFPSLTGSMPADRRQVLQWRIASAPLLILAAFSTFINDLNMALLGTIVSKPDLAVFGVCLKLALIVEYAVSLIHELAAPDISDALVRKQSSMVDVAVARVNVMAVIATLSAVVGVVLFGRLVLSMFGPDFVRAYPILLMLVVSQFIRAAFGPSMLTLISAGAQKSVVIVFSIAIVGFAIGNMVLVPVFGLIGAGAAFVLMTAFWTGSLALIAKNKVGLRLDIAASFGVMRQNPMTLKNFIGGATRHRN